MKKGNKMKVIIQHKYGDPSVLQIEEVEKPIPASNEVLVKNMSTSVTLYDCWQRSATAPPGFGLLMRMVTGIRKPKQPILGTEFAGEIEAVGVDVTRFKSTNQVFGYLGMNLGAYAQYLSLPEDGVIALKPTNMTFSEAGTVQQGGLTALYFLRAAKIQAGQKILIIGASGGVGSFAVQLAKYFGADVTGVCSTSKVELVRTLGAKKVIDYKKEDYLSSGESYDIILDTIGKTNISKTKKLLKRNGYYLFTTFGIPKLLRILMLRLRSDINVFMGTLKENTEDLIFLKELIEAGELKVVLDKEYSIDQTAEAHAYLESGQKQGQIAIKLH